MRRPWRGDPLESGSDRGGRCRPHQEHRIDAVQTRVQRLRTREVSAHHLDVWTAGERRRGLRASARTRTPVAGS